MGAGRDHTNLPTGAELQRRGERLEPYRERCHHAYMVGLGGRRYCWWCGKLPGPTKIN